MTVRSLMSRAVAISLFAFPSASSLSVDSSRGVSWTLVQHAHTKHSFDSLAAPQDLVKVALAGGVHVLAVTDHDTWQGSVDVRAAAQGTALRVILGVERFTDHGDIIGLFLTSDVVEKSALGTRMRVKTGVYRGTVTPPTTAVDWRTAGRWSKPSK